MKTRTRTHASTCPAVVGTIEQSVAEVGANPGDRIVGESAGGASAGATAAATTTTTTSPTSPTSPTGPVASPSPNNSHRRNVSWGINDTIINVPTNLGPQARTGRQTSDASALSSGHSVVQDAHSMNVNMNMNMNMPYSPSGSGTRRPLRKLANLNLDTLTRNNPIEEEAEAILIRAIEKREPSMRHMIMEGSSNAVLGGNLPNATVDAIFKNIATEGHHDVAMITSTSTEPPRTITAALSGDSEGGTANKNQANALPRGGEPRRGGRHRRVQTMEQQLYGLSTAIDAVHTRHPESTILFDTKNIESSRSRANTWDMGGGGGGGGVETIPENIQEPKSSADVLSQNASILFRRTSVRNLNYRPDSNDAQRQDDTSVSNHFNISSSGSVTSSHTTNLQKLRQGLKANVEVHPKKTDSYDGSNCTHVEPNAKIDEANDLEIGTESSENNKDSNGQEVGDASNGRPAGAEASIGKPPRRRFRFIPGGLMFEEWKFGQEFQDYINPMKGSIRTYIRIAIFYLIIPALGIAAILFYLAGNPPIGILANHGKPDADGKLWNTDGEQVSSDVTSYSWWLLFLCVRQVVTFSMAKLMEMILIDFFSIRLGVTFKLFGAWSTLFIMQSKGWPFILFWWSILDLLLLYGTHTFFSQWLFWQEAIKLFNASNPSGDIVNSDWYLRILVICVFLSFATAIKRFSMGLYLGKQTFAQYSENLTTVMKKILLISQVGALGRDIERKANAKLPAGRGQSTRSRSTWTEDRLEDLLHDAGDDSTVNTHPSANAFGFNASHPTATTHVIDPDDRHPLTGKLNASQKNRITQLLGAWEEPTTSAEAVGPISVSSLLQFRRALACLNTDFPFGGSFGYAATREECIVSSQEVFQRLLLRLKDSETLNFEVLALLGVHTDGSLDQQKLVELIKLFRPDRDGTLSILDFVKSVDKVYREIRLLRASVSNSTKIDSALENIVNVFYYGVVLALVLSALGFDPLALFVSVSGVVVAFAFMIGSASSKYFEGLLFILVRRPYAIGDAIHVSDLNSETSYHGSGWWMVTDVNLFTTSVVFSFTNERASLSNGSLANSRIINSTQSPNAGMHTMLKVPIGVPYEKIQLLHQALEEYVRNRPREWLGLSSFRATRIEAAEGFIEYLVAYDHRESWAAWTTIKTSQAHLLAFALEASKQLGINYQSPPLPVNLSLVNRQQLDGLTGMNLPTHVSTSTNDSVLRGGHDSRTMNLQGSELGQPYEQNLRNLQAMFAPPKQAAEGDTVGDVQK